jgi:hypothetical protein
MNSKHVVFGRVIAGQEVIKIVENELTDKSDKPFSYVSIANCGELIKKSAAGTSRPPLSLHPPSLSCARGVLRVCRRRSFTFAHLWSKYCSQGRAERDGGDGGQARRRPGPGGDFHRQGEEVQEEALPLRL